MTDQKARLKIAGDLHGKGIFPSALDAAQKEFAELLSKRQGIDNRLAVLQRLIDDLVAVCEEQNVKLPKHLDASLNQGAVGLTDAIRRVLQARKEPMTPTEVRDALLAAGVDLKKYSSPMVAVHNTLKRLYDQGELARSKGEPVRYAWVDQVTRALSRTFFRRPGSVEPVPIPIPTDFELK